MNVLLGLAAGVGVLALLVYALLRTPPAQLARRLRMAAGITLVLVAVGLLVLGRFALALPVGFTGFMILRRVAVRTGVPLRRVQDWRGLVLGLTFAAGCATIAWHIDRALLTDRAPLERLIAGGFVLAATYGLVLFIRKTTKK